jgi:hypothetical protein
VYDDEVLEEITAAIDELDPPVDDAVLRELLALRDRVDVLVAEQVARFDAAELWRGDGSVSMVGWIQRHARLTGGGARALVKSARLAHECPEVGEAWQAGRLSGGQVQVLATNVIDPLRGLFAQHAGAVVRLLEPLDVRDTITATQRWVQRAKIELALDGKLPEEPARTMHLSPMLDGRGKLDASLDPAAFDVARTALRLAERRDAEGEDRTPAQRRADALVDLCRHFLDHQQVKVGGRHRPHVNVVIDHEHLQDGQGGRTLEGAPLDPAAMGALLCDANIHRVIRQGGSSILDYGRATRSIPPAVYTSLVLRDVGCRFPGCDRPASWTEGHHLWHWEHGGPTNLGNLVLLCSHHHQLIHRKGWEIELLPTGTVEVTRPDGQVMSSDPPSPSFAVAA